MFGPVGNRLRRVDERLLAEGRYLWAAAASWQRGNYGSAGFLLLVIAVLTASETEAACQRRADYCARAVQEADRVLLESVEPAGSA
jgi:hypothetical protein